MAVSFHVGIYHLPNIGDGVGLTLSGEPGILPSGVRVGPMRRRLSNPVRSERKQR
jgi:hypothetical protein